MAPRASIRAPTTASLPDDLRIRPNTPSLLKPLNRLSRSSLIDVALQWLDEKNIDLYPPYLARRGGIDGRQGGEWEENEDEDETNPYPAARDAEEVRSVYEELRDRKGGKREVIDRILEGDWRQGLSLRQLATIDTRFIEDHPAGQQRWTALQLTRTSARESTDREDLSASLPRFHASTFLRNLQREISPLVKAHYHISRLKSLPLTLLRIFVTDSPYRQPRQPSHTFLDASRIIYVAFPDSCPFIYTSLSSPASPATSSSSANNLTTNAKTLRMIVRDSIPKALSRPQERYSLQSTSLTAKSLQTLLSLRGPGRTNAANGIFSIFAEAVVDTSPVDPRFTSLPSTSVDSEDKENSDKAARQTREASADTRQKRPLADSSNYSSQKGNNKDPQASKKRKLQTAAAASRFGTTTSKTTAPLDRLQIHLQDPPRLYREETPEPATYADDVHINTETPTSRTMTLTFSGTDVISGIRQLAECGIVDPERMPSWMTGEEGVSSAVIRGGRRRGRG